MEQGIHHQLLCTLLLQTCQFRDQDVGTSISILPFPGRDQQLSRLSLLETKLIAGRASPSHNPGQRLGSGFSKI